MQVDSGSTFDLQDYIIVNGIVTVDGLLNSTGGSAIDGAAITIDNTGTLESTSGTLTIDPGSIDNAGLLEANGGALTIDATPVTNTGSLEATDNSTLTLSSNTVINIGGTWRWSPVRRSTSTAAASPAALSTSTASGTRRDELDQWCQRPQYRHAGSGKRSADHRFQLDRQFRSNRGQWRCADHRCHVGNQFRHARSDQWRNADAVGRYCRQYPWLHSAGYPQSSGVHLHRNGR